MVAWRGLWAVTTPRPDVLVAADGQTVAVRGADGRLSVLRTGRDTFAVKEWLAADGDGRANTEGRQPGNGVTCDAIGCIGRLADGRLVSHGVRARSLRGGLRRAAVVVSARGGAAELCGTLIDRGVSRTHGAMALCWSGEGFEHGVTRPPATTGRGHAIDA